MAAELTSRTDILVSPETTHPLEGLGIVLVQQETGLLYVIRENEPKNGTRTPGKVGIPLETRKQKRNGKPEKPLPHVYGALAEVIGTDDSAIPEFKQRLKVDRGNFIIKNPIPKFNGREVTCPLAYLVYQGQDLPPIHSQEITPIGWMSLPDLLDHPDTRLLAAHILRATPDLKERVNRLRESPNLVPFLPPKLSMLRLWAQREQQKDMNT